MRILSSFLACLLGLSSVGFLVGDEKEPTTPPPVPMFATNTAGFVQNGPNGPNNLVLFTVPLPPEAAPGCDLPDPPAIVQLEFTVIGDLSTGNDSDGDGVDDSLGNFSGLEWSTGNPGSGTLIGCVLNDEVGNGEVYRITPETGATTLIGKAPEGLVLSINLEAGGSGYGSSGYPVTGGSGQNMTVSVGAGAGGSVVSVDIFDCGSGYQVNDVVTIAGGNFNATFRVTEVIQETGFSDLAFHPLEGRMYAIMNDIVDDGGMVEFLPNTLWVDTNGDLVPDRKTGISLFGLPGQFATDQPFCLGTSVLQTLANGITFDEDGLLYVYDNVEEEVFFGGPGCLSPFPGGFGDITTGLNNSGMEDNSGLAVVNGDDLIIATGAANNETFISTFYIPDIMAPAPDPEPPTYLIAEFNQQFSQNDFFAEVAIGDLVGAMSDLDDLPSTFPDNIVVNKGTTCKGSVLEAVVVSDDFRYCVFAEPPQGNGTGTEVDFVFTLANPSNLSALGLEIEGQPNTPGLRQTISVFNITTGKFQAISTNPINIVNDDETVVVDLTFGIENYVNQTNGTLICRIETKTDGFVLMYPWSIKYDAVLVISE